jgi:hypothetical protein
MKCDNDTLEQLSALASTFLTLAYAPCAGNIESVRNVVASLILNEMKAILCDHDDACAQKSCSDDKFDVITTLSSAIMSNIEDLMRERGK